MNKIYKANGVRHTTIRFDAPTNKRMSEVINSSTMSQNEIIKLLLNFAVTELQEKNNQSVELKRIRLSQDEYKKLESKQSPAHKIVESLSDSLDRLEKLTI